MALALLFHRAGSELFQESLILRSPSYCDVDVHAPRNIRLDFSWKLLNFLEVREHRLPVGE